MSLTIRPLSLPEIPNFIRLNGDAFHQTNALSRAMAPNGTSPARRKTWEEKAEKDITKDGPSNVHVMCAFDDATGDIVAGSRWEVEDLTKRGKEEKKNEEEKEEEQAEDPEFPFRKEVWEIFKKQMEESCKWAMDGQRFWHLHLLFANLAHGRRGGATKLLQWAIERADAEGLACYLDGTEMGRPLYEKMGFEVRRIDEIDLRKWGVDATNLSFVMVRPPKAKTNIKAATAEMPKGEQTVSLAQDATTEVVA